MFSLFLLLISAHQPTSETRYPVDHHLMMNPKTRRRRPPARWDSLCNLAITHPVKALTLSFVVWKFLLLVIIVCSPGPGYDTSTTLLRPEWPEQTNLRSSLLRFVRWDSIYFVRIAERGYEFEQEWAFGYGRTLSFFSSGI